MSTFSERIRDICRIFAQCSILQILNEDAAIVNPFYFTTLMNKLFTTLSLSVLLLMSCSKSSTPTSNNNTNTGGNGGAGTNQVVATIDGTKMTFNTYATSGSGSDKNGVVSFGVGGVDSVNGTSFAIGGGGIVSTGTYDIGLTSISPVYAFGMSYNKTVSGGNTLTYGTNNNNTSKVGTITISSISATGAQGTFTATLPLTSGQSGVPSSVSITNGGFNVVFQ